MNEDKVREALKELEILLQDNNLRSREFNAAQLLKQALAPEPRFYVGQQVLVSSDGSKKYLDHTRNDNSVVLYVTESGCSAKKDNSSVRLDLKGNYILDSLGDFC